MINSTNKFNQDSPNLNMFRPQSQLQHNIKVSETVEEELTLCKLLQYETPSLDSNRSNFINDEVGSSSDQKCLKYLFHL